MITEDGSKLNFQEELENLINRHSKENGSNTPDYILAKYLNDCLDAFNSALQTKARHEHNANTPVIGSCEHKEVISVHRAYRCKKCGEWIQ
jgi:hypothetical protein